MRYPKAYKGSLIYRTAPKPIQRIMASIAGQKARTKKKFGYVWVEYSSRDFIDWYLREIHKRKKWVCPTVGRIDHDKGYFFGNIELVERRENSLERHSRLPMPGKAVLQYLVEDGSLIARYKTMAEAARKSGYCINTVYDHCRGNLRAKPKKKHYFVWES